LSNVINVLSSTLAVAKFSDKKMLVPLSKPCQENLYSTDVSCYVREEYES